MFEKPLCCSEDRIMTNKFLVHLLVDSSTWAPQKIQTRTQGYTNALFPSPDRHTLHIQAQFHQGFGLDDCSLQQTMPASSLPSGLLMTQGGKKGKQMQLMSWKNNTLVQISIRKNVSYSQEKGEKNLENNYKKEYPPMPFKHSHHR